MIMVQLSAGSTAEHESYDLFLALMVKWRSPQDLTLVDESTHSKFKSKTNLRSVVNIVDQFYYKMNRSFNEKTCKLKLVHYTDASTHDQDYSTTLSRVLDERTKKPISQQYQIEDTFSKVEGKSSKLSAKSSISPSKHQPDSVNDRISQTSYGKRVNRMWLSKQQNVSVQKIENLTQSVERKQANLYKRSLTDHTQSPQLYLKAKINMNREGIEGSHQASFARKGRLQIKIEQIINDCERYGRDDDLSCQPILNELKSEVTKRANGWLKSLRSEEERYIDHVCKQMKYRVILQSDTQTIHLQLEDKIRESQSLKYSIGNRLAGKYMKKLEILANRNPKYFHHQLLMAKKKKQATQIQHTKIFSQQQNKDLCRLINFSDFIGFS